MYWDIKRSLSYNCLFNFIIGNRGGGKSYGFKKWAIDDFLKTGSQFVYVRRYKTEIKTVDRFFNDIAEAYPEHDFKSIKGKFYIDDKLAGFAVALSTAAILKSVPFPKVNKICYDEFIIDRGTYRYLRDEVTVFLELYETIARMRDNVRVFFLANAVSTFNPYFIYFDLSLPYGTSIKRKDDILLQMVADEDFIEEKSKTRFARLLKDTAYYSYSVENKMLRDNNNFIRKKTGNCKKEFCIKNEGKYYGIWFSLEEDHIYVEPCEFDNGVLTIALTKDDHSINTRAVDYFKSTQTYKAIKLAINDGNCFYADLTTKNIMYNLFLYTMK